MRPIVTGPIPEMETWSGLFTRFAQVSWVVRLSRLGAERALTTEKRATSGTNERMLAVEMGREGDLEQKTREVSHFYTQAPDRPVNPAFQPVIRWPEIDLVVNWNEERSISFTSLPACAAAAT